MISATPQYAKGGTSAVPAGGKLPLLHESACAGYPRFTLADDRFLGCPSFDTQPAPLGVRRSSCGSLQTRLRYDGRGELSSGCGSFDLRQCRCSNEWESDADRWIPAYAGMTNRAAGMRCTVVGMTNRDAGMRCTVVGMTNRAAGMTNRAAGMTASGLTIWRQPAP